MDWDKLSPSEQINAYKKSKKRRKEAKWKKDTNASIRYTEEKKQEYARIEAIVMRYKKQFEPDATQEDVQDGQQASRELIESFTPLFKKYIAMLRLGQISWTNTESRNFVKTFMQEKDLIYALKRTRISKELKERIEHRFKFITETYGKRPEDEIKLDLIECLLYLAKKYKQMGRSFCAYLYRAFLYEVQRFVKRYTSNPVNIHYRRLDYEEVMEAHEPTTNNDGSMEEAFANHLGIPDISWIQGKTCSDGFSELSPEQRKILVAYYLEEDSDRNIASDLGERMGTISKKRKEAILSLALKLGYDPTLLRCGRQIIPRVKKKKPKPMDNPIPA
jgi:hypothetical protein